MKILSTGSEGYHTWTVEEVHRFEARHPVGSKARLALSLMLYAGLRRSDAVALGRQHVRDGWLTFTVTKNRRRKPVTLQLPILPVLQAVIDATPSGNLSFLVTQFGKPFTAKGFGGWFRRRCDEAGLPHCSAHGLRKAGATIAAENGATENQLMGMFGWSSPKQPAHYTKAARQKVLAADPFDAEHHAVGGAKAHDLRHRLGLHHRIIENDRNRQLLAELRMPL